MQSYIDKMINKEFSNGEFTHESFDRLYLKVRAGDMLAIKHMTDLVFPYIYRYIVKSFSKDIIDNPSELASYIYESILKYTKSLAKKGEKNYYSFTSQLKIAVRRDLTRIVEKETKLVNRIVSDAIITNLEDEIVNNLQNERINDTLQTLSERERFVLTEYLGLNGKEKKTLNQVGKLMGVGRKTVFQIYTCALRKLRMPTQARKLIDLYD